MDPPLFLLDVYGLLGALAGWNDGGEGGRSGKEQRSGREKKGSQ